MNTEPSSLDDDEFALLITPCHWEASYCLKHGISHRQWLRDITMAELLEFRVAALIDDVRNEIWSEQQEQRRREQERRR